jgi:hypothetical protein
MLRDDDAVLGIVLEIKQDLTLDTTLRSFLQCTNDLPPGAFKLQQGEELFSKWISVVKFC